MKITNGIYEVFDSGSIICFDEHPITFHLADDLRVSLVFERKDIAESRIEFESSSKEDLYIKFINFGGLIAQGSKEPMFIGELNDRNLYFHLRTHSYGGADSKHVRTIFYTWYLGAYYSNAGKGDQNG